jgi:hypothetical protein
MADHGNATARRRARSCARVVAALALAACPTARAEAPAADSAAVPRGPLFHPDGPGPYRFRLGVGALVDVLPTRVVQSEQRQIPQVTVEARYGLPLGFSVDARLSAIFVSNELAIGPAWTYRIGVVSLAVQDRQAFWYGYLGTSGFDATGWGYINRPGLSVGVPWRSERFSLTGELIYTLGQYAKLGDSQIVKSVQTKLAGTALTFVLESMLDAGGIIYFGAGLLRTTVDYQAWIAFSDQRATLPYPRFLAGYVF